MSQMKLEDDCAESVRNEVLELLRCMGRVIINASVSFFLLAEPYLFAWVDVRDLLFCNYAVYATSALCFSVFPVWYRR